MSALAMLVVLAVIAGAFTVVFPAVGIFFLLFVLVGIWYELGERREKRKAENDRS